MVEIGVPLDASLSLLGYQIGVHFFQTTSGNKVATIEDKNMRFELVGDVLFGYDWVTRTRK